MSVSQMRAEDRLAGASNWSSWKARMVFVLEDLELWDIVEAVVPAIPVTAPVLVAEYRKRNNKAKRTISDGVRDHIIPHVTGKAHAYQMWASLCSLYESSNENRKMVLHDRLRSIRMLEDESVTSFLARFTQIRDELGAVGEVIVPNSLVRQALHSFTKPWASFIQGIVAREALPTWERMWDDFAQEEIRLASESSGQRQQQSGQGDEELALWTKGKKKTGRGGQQGPKTGGQSQRSGGGAESSGGQGNSQMRDMSTVRCFACGEMGHYAGQCPKKKKKKQQDGSAATAEEMEFSDQFVRECAFITTLSTITPSSISWGDRVDEDRLTHSSDSEGDQTQCPWTDSEWVTGPPSIATVSEQPSRQRDGATASVHQRMMRRSSRAPQRLEPHMAYETGRSGSGSTSGGGDLARGQVDDSW
jgi:uncharacterized membrane protein YgcG